MRIEQNGLHSLNLLKLLKPAHRHASQYKLSADERAAIQQISEGRTLQQVADAMNCSSMSVKRLVSSAREKYRVATTNALIAKAVESGEIRSKI